MRAEGHSGWFPGQAFTSLALEIVKTLPPLAPVPGPLFAWVRVRPLSPACFVPASLRLWGHSPFAPHPLHMHRKVLPLAQSVPEELASRECPSSPCGEAWAPRTSLLQASGLCTDRLSQGHTCYHSQRQKHAMTKSYGIPTTPPIQICHRHILPKMFLVVRFSRTPDTYDNASHKSSLPSGDAVACFPRPLPLPHTLVPHTLSLSFSHWGGWNQAGTVSPYWVP